MEDRKQLINVVDELVKDFCDGCFLYKQNRKEKGKTYAHRFCINECTVGEKFKEIGKKLS